MNTFIEGIHLFLCPNIPPIKIKNRCTLTKQQLYVTVKDNAVVMYQSTVLSIVKCVVIATVAITMINDNEGIEVCLGRYRKGCGNVLYMKGLK